jgi:hypothetical protein
LAEKLENFPVVKWAGRHFVFDDNGSDGSHDGGSPTMTTD